MANLESCKVKTVAKAAGYDIVLMPPDDETVTDEDSDEEDDAIKAGNPNHLGKGILRQEAELVIIDNDEEPSDLEEVREISQNLYCLMKFLQQ